MHDRLHVRLGFVDERKLIALESALHFGKFQFFVDVQDLAVRMGEGRGRVVPAANAPGALVCRLICCSILANVPIRKGTYGIIILRHK